MTVAYTLAAEEAQKAAKLAAETALDSRRHDVVTRIYSLHPRKRSLLSEARRKEEEKPVPPRLREILAAAGARPASAPNPPAALRPPLTRSERGSRGRIVSGRQSPSSRPNSASPPRFALQPEGDVGVQGPTPLSVHPAASAVRWQPAKAVSPGGPAAPTLSTPVAAADEQQQQYADEVADHDQEAEELGPSEAMPPDAAVKEARRKRQLRFKARRILRKAIQLAGRQMAAAAIDTREFTTLARTAVIMRKCHSALAQSELLADLGEIQLSMMASSGKRRYHKRYTVLYHEGSIASSFYILVHGVLEERAIGQPSTTLESEGSRPASEYVLFGMESLLGRPRMSTIAVEADCEVIRFSASHLNIREDGALKVARKVFNAFVEGELAHMPPFKDLPHRTLKQLVPLFSLEEHPAATQLFTVGNPGDKVYILMHGSVTISKGALVLTSLSAEQGQSASSANEIGLPVFGEMAMLDRKPRMATATTATDCKLLVLPVEQFAACMYIVPDVKARLRRIKQIRKKQNEVDDRRRIESTVSAPPPVFKGPIP